MFNLKNLNFFLITFFSFSFLILVIYNFLCQQTDPDVDHFMYFGFRAINGELPFAYEPADKLPGTYIFFLLPGLYGSPSLYKLSALIIMVVTFIYFAKFVFKELSAYLNKDFLIYISVIISIISGFILLYVPGQLAHINIIPGCFMLLSFLLRFNISTEKYISDKYCLLNIFPAILAALAITIRPYLIFILVFSEAWIFLKLFKFDTKKIIKNIKLFFIKNFIWNFFVILLIIFFNFIPYVFISNLESFQAGLEFLSLKIVPQNILDNINYQFYELIFTPLQLILFSIIFLLICFFIKSDSVNNIELRKAKFDFFITSLFFPVFLEIMLLSRHTWPHYQQFILPLYFLSFLYFIKILILLNFFKNNFINFFLFIILIFGCYKLFLFDKFFISNYLFNKHYYNHVDQKDLDYFENYIASNNLKYDSFLYPYSMFFHWKLKESRHGFPQAQHLNHALDLKWFDNLSVNKNFFFPKNIEELCKKISDSNISLIIERDDKIKNCLSNSVNYYLLNKEDGDSGLHIYKLK